MLTVGNKFPNFTLQGVDNCNDFVKVQLNEDNWNVVYFYPKDFTFICPTEIAGMDILVKEANVIGISGDNEFCKLAWKKDNDLIGGIKHSLAADCGLGLSHELGIVNSNEKVCYRATFIIDPNGKIAQYPAYPPSPLYNNQSIDVTFFNLKKNNSVKTPFGIGGKN